jgi:hypothetical protein
MRAGLAWVVAAALLAVPAAAQAGQIPGGSTSEPAFVGHPFAPAPVFAPLPPRHPFMAPNGSSNLHEDAYQSDASERTGPLGRDMETTSTFYSHECASVTFDGRGRLVTVCVGLDRPILKLLDPHTLAEIASFDLPPRQPGGDPSTTFTSFGGGGYFYLDNQDRAIVPTTDLHIYTAAIQGDAFVKTGDIDLSGVLPSGDSILSALPDFSGALWFASKTGIVGRIDPSTHAIKVFRTGEAIGNSFAIGDDGGVYIVTDAAMYRFDTGPDGTPAVTWRETYPNTGQLKPGQTEHGSGTTPTLMGSDLVAITDNADPMDIVVFKRAPHITGPRTVCVAPVFSKGASDTDNSLIATDSAMVVENNYGYSGPAATEQGKTTTPGLERVDIDRATGKCTKVWHSDERAPSVVAKLSRGNGLVYTYTKDPASDTSDPWYLTALDFRTGATVYKRLAGEGLGFNNNYAPVTIGPDGTAYVGTLGGLVAMRDKVAPAQTVLVKAPPAGAPRGLRVSVRLQRGKRRCIARVSGGDRRLARKLSVLTRTHKLIRRDTRAPLRVRFKRRHRKLRFVVTLDTRKRVVVISGC